MSKSTMIGLGAALLAAAVGAGPAAAQEQDKPFRSMAVEDGRETACLMPEIPSELVPTIGHEDAYLYWIEKLELERRLESGECHCQVDEITWEEVGVHALPWLEDTSRLFIVMRREIEGEIEALRLAVLAECAG